ncbi:MAG: PKD domain-containing protein [Chitinophagales bacterium]
MKKNLLSLTVLMLAARLLSAQTVVFYDDFEAGLGNWTYTGLWNTTTTDAYSPTHCFTDSPDGNYPDMFSSEAEMAVGADLSTALDADLQVYALVDLEEGFDYVYVDASGDGGASWTPVYTFNGEGLFTWTLYDIPLGAFVGNSDVRIRFRFESDAAYNVDGLYLDDFTITTYNVDGTPPLILHTPTNLYEGTLGENPLEAVLLDPSGISVTTLWYSADGGPYTPVSGVNTMGDTWLYSVPELAPGTWVDYYIEATDAYVIPNGTATDTYSYIAGNYISYDDGAIDFVADIGDASTIGYTSAAVKVTLDGVTDLVAAVIQNYTDYMRPNHDIEVHVWADEAGLPGADLITPIVVSPEPTLEDPNKGTRIDLRGIPELEGIYGDVYVGYTVTGDVEWLSYTSTGIVDRSYVETAFGWSSFFGDFHFRAVTSALEGAPVALYTYDLAGEPAVDFTDLSTNSPDTWYWDFDDGTTSDLQNPTHTFLTNGTYNVCLTASNFLAADTYCDLVTIDIYAPPVVDFSFSGDPDVDFTDLSINFPTSWSWDFGDGGTSTLQNPVHSYADDGTFNVCLTATNAEGSASVCKDVSISNSPKAPDVDFSYTFSGSNVIFTDLSINTPTSWDWSFGDGSNSAEQNPVHAYAVADGAYTVCLTAGNIIGENTSCKVIEFPNAVVNADVEALTITPVPADAYITLHGTFGSDAHVSILDMIGKSVRVVALQNGNTLDIHDLASGTYLLRVEDGSHTCIGVMIKK